MNDAFFDLIKIKKYYFIQPSSIILPYFVIDFFLKFQARFKS